MFFPKWVWDPNLQNDDLPSDLMNHSLKIWNLPVTNELSYRRLAIQNPHWVIFFSVNSHTQCEFSRFFPFRFPLDFSAASCFSFTTTTRDPFIICTAGCGYEGRVLDARFWWMTLTSCMGGCCSEHQISKSEALALGASPVLLLAAGGLQNMKRSRNEWKLYGCFSRLRTFKTLKGFSGLKFCLTTYFLFKVMHLWQFWISETVLELQDTTPTAIIIIVEATFRARSVFNLPDARVVGVVKSFPDCFTNLIQGSLYYQPKQCLVIREFPRNYDICLHCLITPK